MARRGWAPINAVATGFWFVVRRFGGHCFRQRPLPMICESVPVQIVHKFRRCPPAWLRSKRRHRASLHLRPELHPDLDVTCFYPRHPRGLRCGASGVLGRRDDVGRRKMCQYIMGPSRMPPTRAATCRHLFTSEGLSSFNPRCPRGQRLPAFKPQKTQDHAAMCILVTGYWRESSAIPPRHAEIA
jgi:hypothetical protein